MGCAWPQIPLSPHPSRPNPSRPKTVSTVKDVVLLVNLELGIPNLRDLRGHRRAFSDLHTSQRNGINSYCGITLILPHSALCLCRWLLCAFPCSLPAKKLLRLRIPGVGQTHLLEFPQHQTDPTKPVLLFCKCLSLICLPSGTVRPCGQQWN